MAPRPFPLPLRSGIDICSLARISRLLRKPSARSAAQEYPSLPSLHHVLRRVLTTPERALFWKEHREKFVLYGPEKGSERVTQYLAGRWAAKEAVIKACPRRLRLSDIVVLRAVDGGVYGVVLDGTSERQRSPGDVVKAAKTPGDDMVVQEAELMTDHQDDISDISLIQANQKIHDALDGQVVPISISHDGGYAVATCIYSPVPQDMQAS